MTARSLPAAAFARARAAVLRAVDPATTRPTLRCVLLEAADGGLRLVATDAARLVVCDVPGDGQAGEARALVDARALGGVEVATDGDGDGGGDGDGTVVVDMGDDHVTVTATDGTATTLALVTADFPNYGLFLAPDPAARPLTVDRAALVDAIEDLPDDEPLRVRIGPGELRLGGVGPITLPASYDGEVLSLLVNAVFLHDAAESVVGERLVIEASSPVSPIVIRSADDDACTTVLMPMKSAGRGPTRR